MSNNRIKYLSQRYLLRTLTDAEAEEWHEVVNDPNNEELLLSMIEKTWKSTPENLLEELPANPSKTIIDKIVSQPQIKVKKIKMWPRIAAAVAMVIMIGSLFYYNAQKDQVPPYQNDIAPGSKNGATLTLSNGKKIRINDVLTGNIANESGIKISKTEDGKINYELTGEGNGTLSYNTLSTTRGEQAQLRLPDGTIVYLNAESSLKYPANFAHLKKREVALVGEGYFEVTKDKEHPFIVKTDKQEVEVLGTHFNVNSYANNKRVITTLQEGSIKVRTKANSKIIVPNQEALTGEDGLIQVQTADMEQALAWKNGKMIFKSATIEQIMRQVERWYDIHVEYEGEIPKYLISGGLSRNSKLSVLLDILKDSEIKYQLKYSPTGVTLIIKP